MSPAAQHPRRVPMILDVDTGVDDAQALLLAARCPWVDLLAVTCVQGNVGVDQVLENTFRVLDAADAPEDLPVARGFDAPLVEPAKHCTEIHGEDGLADLEPPLPRSQRQPWKGHAVQLLLETLRKAEEPITVVALAPLTNIAVAIRTEPALWHTKVSRLVWMGGAVASGGNASVWAEANARYDPEAAHIVLSSGLPILIYPWDVFLQVAYSREELRAVDGGTGEESPASVANGHAKRTAPEAFPEQQGPWCTLALRILRAMMKKFGDCGGQIGDAGAVACALHPAGAATVRRLHVAMELQGARTRGMTVCDLRGEVHPPDDPAETANVDVITEVSVGEIKRFFSEHVFGKAAAKEVDEIAPLVSKRLKVCDN